MVIMVVLVCGIVTFKRQELDITNAKSAARVAELNEEIVEGQEEAKDILDMKAYVQTMKYIEEMAREKLGLVYKDEIIFKAKEWRA